jgi:hypothetical protein
MTPLGGLTNYDIYTVWTTETCPTSRCIPDPGNGKQEICYQNLSLGTYRLTVKKIAGTNYNLNLTCKDYCNQCLPDSHCNISCGQSIVGLKTGDTQYLYYTLDSSKHIEINMTPVGPGLDNYDLWTNVSQSFVQAGQCPTSRCILDPTGNNPEICSNDLPAGTYILGIRRIAGTTATYNLNLTCKEIIIQPTLIKPEETTYYTQTIDLTAKCTGSYSNYNINRSLNNSENITFGFSVANDTQFTNSTTLSNLAEGSYSIFITCYNSSVPVSSSVKHFSIVIPRYSLTVWSRGPSLFTIGRPETINVYVKNTGNMNDSFSITPIKYASKNLQNVSHLVDVNMPSNKIVSVEPGKIGNTFATVTLSGLVDSGTVRFNITSGNDPTSYSLTSQINISTGSPINLPEFESYGLFQILIFASFLLMFSLYMKKRKINSF